MGFKRSFDGEEFQEFSFKHPKLNDYGNKLTSFAENFPSYEVSMKADKPGEAEGIFHKLQVGEELQKGDAIVSELADKEFESSVPLSWATSTMIEEDAGSGAAFFSSFSPEYLEFNFPRRTFVQFEDTYSALLNSSPRKEVPVGSNHQADVPIWNPQAIEKHSLSSSYTFYDESAEEKLMGNCVIPMPESKLSAYDGAGGPDCGCLDEGSVRCVRQHVKKKRDKLKESLGHEKFVDLGFSEMGEEVADKWTEEEERVFHEVVYSNPVSLGKNFWEQLWMMFPSRTKRELVSYYFNAFMLRRRAAQNRSNLLAIDSDNDEWQGNDDGAFGASGEDEDSVVESVIDQDLQLDFETDSLDDDGDNDEDNDSDADDGGDMDGHARDYGEDAIEKDGGSSHISEGQIENLVHDCRFDFLDHQGNRSPGSIREGFDVLEDSCTSFESQPHKPDFYCPVDGGTTGIQESGVEADHRKCLHGKSDRSDDVLVPGYVLELPDSKVWDASYQIGDGFDFLPTRNMIEEIFGPCSRNK